jgi:ribosomal protein S18 acetylase RimI-like enzyme
VIEAVPFADVLPYAARAAREHVSVSDTRRTTWHAERLDGALLGFAGLLEARQAWRIKGVWVEPAARGMGIGNRLAHHLIRLAQDGCAPAIEAFAWNPAYYLAFGFVRYGTLPNGAVKLRRTL